MARLVNYRGSQLQNEVIKSHSGPAIVMASTIFAAGAFLGVMEESGIMDHMANVLASLIPASMGKMLPLFIGILSVPLALLFRQHFLEPVWLVWKLKITLKPAFSGYGESVSSVCLQGSFWESFIFKNRTY